MKFVDLEAQQEVIRDELRSRIDAVLAHGKFIMGPEIQELEERLAPMAGTAHAIGCASGTDGLLMALMALDVGPGDMVLTTPFTFIATAEVVKLLGATPVFVDIREDTFNIDPEKVRPALDRLTAEERRRVKGLIAVDLFGLPADYDALCEVLDDGHFIIEDAAQSFGASYKSRPAGCFGDIAVTSFFPAKPLGCYGDGGAVFTDSDELADKLRSIRIHGKGKSKYDNIRLGINGRLDTIQAAVLLAKLTVFEDEVSRRQEIATRYTEELNGVRPPIVAEGYTSAWASYAILCDKRDKVQERLAEKNIPTMIYYSLPLHMQGVFRESECLDGTFPAAESASERILNLPIHPYLGADEVESIVRIINRNSAT